MVAEVMVLVVTKISWLGNGYFYRSGYRLGFLHAFDYGAGSSDSKTRPSAQAYDPWSSKCRSLVVHHPTPVATT
ncbi:hypothetical protein GCM10027405_19950 [Arthrobacter alkaliphilus]